MTLFAPNTSAVASKFYACNSFFDVRSSAYVRSTVSLLQEGLKDVVNGNYTTCKLRRVFAYMLHYPAVTTKAYLQALPLSLFWVFAPLDLAVMPMF